VKEMVFEADLAPVPGARGPAAEKSDKKPLCDLTSDRCSSKPLDQIQMAKTVFLTDIVATKLLELEAMEKKAGRDFKVAIIGRMGSNLTKFQPLRDVDAQGNLISTDKLIQNMANESVEYRRRYSSDSTQSGGIEYQVMRSYFDRSRSMKFSHVGIALKNMTLKNRDGVVVSRPDKGHWTVVQLLYSCEDQHISHVFKGTLSNFFYDHMYDYNAQILVPSQEIQNNIEQIIAKDYIGKNWIEAHYNAAALPTDLNQQNSNQYVLEVIAAAMRSPGEVKDRKQAIDILMSTGYATTKVTPTGLYTALAAPGIGKLVGKFMPTVCMTNQPNIKNFGIGEIISALSVQEYLARNNKLLSQHEVGLTKQDVSDIEGSLKKSNNKQDDKKDDNF
jgi:hypothetical protein